ncbi:hypothetical protein A9Q99_21965 [Gammaproteobacteria bacterium 45_16_T64]|nr:hypothetical protein A9Q99_21965 [Gammaproteobacteria bacterium 45_16_T64]
MLKGQCLCGEVAYQYDGELTEVAICHCSQCRRAQGTPFVTNAPVNMDQLTFLSGEHLLKDYFATENKRRVFCSNCGSPIFSQRMDKLDTVRLRLGTFTTPISHTPDYHIYHSDRVEWFDCVAGIPTYAEGNPE